MVTKMKSEKQYPIKLALSLIIVSSILFTALTFGFGFRVNRFTGDMEISTPLDNQAADPWSYDPMPEVWGEFWQYYALAGFFGSMMMFVYLLFQIDGDIAKEENSVQKTEPQKTPEKEA